ncbi:MAG TPA: hypothetical protein PLU38_05665 [Kiritimatiellia bacterium]|jgi:chromosome segregation ATPase|nr:MAG: hypothetical protein BWX70_00220 [Verrucomicrobia bacterium ADurb.Bin070]HPB09994.1 hypothetical protein [Kiritimatiellia bacterium]HPO38068.1 hypothetical protein [Kiritimatiellia bacterium]HQA37669.1 hypothetical protein [Kiritimatiellia bacterium]HQL50911.1 hypothetical protein [Kiritimatiellia bacterium]
MKEILCTLAVCLMVAAAVHTNHSVVRDEGRRTRTALAKTSEPSTPSGESDGAVAKRLDAVLSQLTACNRRITALEETLAASDRGADSTRSVRSDLNAVRQDLKSISASQARLTAVPGYLADLTRYLDHSFARVEQGFDDARMPEALAVALDDLAQRLDAIESLFAALYGALGIALDPQDGQPLAETPSLDARLNQLAEQSDQIRKDIEALRDWMTPRNIDPVKRPR